MMIECDRGDLRRTRGGTGVRHVLVPSLRKFFRRTTLAVHVWVFLEATMRAAVYCFPRVWTKILGQAGSARSDMDKTR